MVGLLHHMISTQEYRSDRFWDPHCVMCISMTFLMVPFQQLEFRQMILLHIPAYKHLPSLIGLRWQQSWRRTYVVLSEVKSGWYHSMLPRPNCFLLIAIVRAPWFLWRWMISRYVLLSVFFNLFLHPRWIGNLMSILLQERHHTGLGLFSISEIRYHADHPVHRVHVAILSLFYKYYHGRCSQELSSLVPHRHLNERL